MKHNPKLVAQLVKEKGIHEATARRWLAQLGPERALAKEPVKSMQARARLAKKISPWKLFKLPGSPNKNE